MDWQKGRESDNVVEDDGSGGGGGFGGGGMRFGGFHLGIGGIILVVVIGLMFPSLRPILFGLFLGGDTGSGVQQSTPAPERQPSNPADPQVKFVRSILGSTEDVWGSYFQASGKQYEQPKLLLFHGRTQSGCGAASESMGPFYGPADHRVYLDLDFFHEMDTRFHAQGDFARAYVIAHEVGHHLQNLLGVMQRVGGRPSEGATGTSVRLELQADCFAGVWGNRSQAQLNWLQAGDVDAALNAASSVGDDTLQKQSRGYAVPDSFTHGTSAQRSRWFKTGFASGDINSCDTFGAATL
ncbi:MAG TPA: neutral zinc metallopeptidase [Rhodanobacteraceae bacterium]|nr:neutral zinc metallopeptidase [Rhodanobacteraceae bacterium]